MKLLSSKIPFVATMYTDPLQYLYVFKAKIKRWFWFQCYSVYNIFKTENQNIYCQKVIKSKNL